MLADKIRLLVAGAVLIAALAQCAGAKSIDQQESRHLYQSVPDARIFLPDGRRAQLSELWREKPLLITLFYSTCTGACNPFLRSLKAAVEASGGIGDDYRILSLSFDPKDTVEDAAKRADALEISQRDKWLVGTASPGDIRRVAESVGFWYKTQPKTGQYDHPTLVAAVRDGKIVRVLLGSTVPKRRFQEMLMDIRGDFLPYYSRPGEKTLFRCLQVDESTGKVKLNWGALILFFPGFAAIVAAAIVFGARKSHDPSCP